MSSLVVKHLIFERFSMRKVGQLEMPYSLEIEQVCFVSFH